MTQLLAELRADARWRRRLGADGDRPGGAGAASPAPADGYSAVVPPSITSSLPVTYEASSEAR